MARSKLNGQKDKPVRLYYSNHKTVKRMGFQCTIAIEKLVNIIIEKATSDRDFMEKVLLELGVEPKCLDEML